MKATLIAAAIVNANAALLQSYGKQPSYAGKLEDAPEAFRVGLLAKVEEFIASPEATLPAPAADTPADELPLFKAQAAMFRAIVDALKPLGDEPAPAPEPAAKPITALPLAVAPDGRKYLPIKYVGKRAEYRDGTYGTGLEFVRGQSRMVPAEAAALMLRHPDVYALGEAAETAPQVQDTGLAAKKKTDDESDEPLQQVRDSVANMTKDALATFAKTHYRVDLDLKQKVGQLREEVTRMIDQYGLE